MWKNIWWVRPPHAVNIHTHIFAMDSFKRKLKFLDNKVCNYFFLGTLILTILPKSKGLKAQCRKHSASQCWHTSGLLLYHVDNLGSHKLPQKFEKRSTLLPLTAAEIFPCLCVLTRGIDSLKAIRIWWDLIFRKHPSLPPEDANESVIIIMNCHNTEKPL